jgi:hypothetical protein
MKKTCLILVAAMLFFACKNTEEDNKAKLDEQAYEQQKESLLEKEKKSPTLFLKISGEDDRNFWGKSVYRGKIENKATQCSYKNVRVKTKYFKSDGTLVTNHEDVFEETIKPGETLEFKTKYKTPKGTDSVVASIMSAIPEK